MSHDQRRCCILGVCCAPHSDAQVEALASLLYDAVAERRPDGHLVDSFDAVAHEQYMLMAKALLNGGYIKQVV